MLLLTRKWEERIVLRTPSDEEVWLTVIQPRSGRGGASIGIVAPRSWTVDREEVDILKRGGTAPTTGHDGHPAGDEVAPTVGDAPGEPG